MTSPASAIILAGGQSRRMGRPKATLEFAGRTILERIIAEMGTGFDDLIVVAAPVAREPLALRDALGSSAPAVRIVRDETAYGGAALALARGLAGARHEVAFACSCDLPLLRAATARALVEMLDGYDAVVPLIGGKAQPLCAVYRRAVAETIVTRTIAGELRLTAIAAGLHAYRPDEAELSRIDPGLHSFLNVNTPADCARALKLVARSSSGD